MKQRTPCISFYLLMICIEYAYDLQKCDLSEVKDFLGCPVVRDRERSITQMSSRPKVDALVENFGLSGETRPVESSMRESFLPIAQGCESREGLGAGTPLEPGNRYCELIGSLLYSANTIRPDIA